MNKNTIKYRLVTLVIVGLMLGGCGSENSGLYRLKAGTEAAEPAGEAASRESEVTDPAYADAAAEMPVQTAYAEQNASPEPDAAQEPAVIYVHVCGAVRNPGVFDMQPGDRVIDAVKRAGGFGEDADESYLNLAMALMDGMKIVIPTLEETAGFELDPMDVITVEDGSAASRTTPAQTGSEGQAAAPSGPGLVNINTADASELTTISGIGQTRAAAILAYRNEHGAFGSVEEIKNVSGIGDATYEKLKDQITVGK